MASVFYFSYLHAGNSMPHNPHQALPELLTNRLLLRKLEPADAARIFELRNNESVNRYIDRPAVSSLEEGLRFIHRINISISEGHSLYWAIVPKQEQDLAGTICLWNWNKTMKRAELGFELLPAWQRQGIMKEALARVLGYALEQLTILHIEAWVHPHNKACIQLLSGAGFRLKPEKPQSTIAEEEKQLLAFYYEG